MSTTRSTKVRDINFIDDVAYQNKQSWTLSSSLQTGAAISNAVVDYDFIIKAVMDYDFKQSKGWLKTKAVAASSNCNKAAAAGAVGAAAAAVP